MKKIKLKLGNRSYYIYIGYNILSKLPKMLKNKNGAVITDSNVYKHWKKALKSLKIPIYVIKPGEGSKSLQTAEKIYKKLLSYGLDRKSYLVAFGGGVVGDLTGFVAATFMRGIPYIQVPTTLMAQVDSSIGGKTAVNLSLGKNLVGSFYQPEFVFADVKTLITLHQKELRNGLSEVIKYGMIRDRSLFEYLEKNSGKLFNIKSDLWVPIVYKCASIKADIVSRDEKETKGLRVFLNYGHTTGHAIEAVNKYKNITHGEAVGIGMKTAAGLSSKLGYLSNTSVLRQNNLIDKLVKVKKINIYNDLFKKMKYDKKFLRGKMRFVLADRIGRVFVNSNIKEKDVKEVIKKNIR